MNMLLQNIQSRRSQPGLTTHQILVNKVRYLQVQNYVLLGLLGLCMIGFISILPLKEVDVRYVEYAHDAEMIPKVFGSKMSTSERQLLIRNYLRNYVTAGEKIDNVNEQERFRFVQMMSSDAVFRTRYDTLKQVKELLEGCLRCGEVIYDTVEGYSQDPTSGQIKGRHEVGFRTIDKTKKGRVSQEWVANMRYRVLGGSYRIAESDALYNPLRIEVLAYNITKKGK